MKSTIKSILGGLLLCLGAISTALAVVCGSVGFTWAIVAGVLMFFNVVTFSMLGIFLPIVLALGFWFVSLTAGIIVSLADI